MNDSTQILHPQFGREFLNAIAQSLHDIGNALFRSQPQTTAMSSQRLRELAAEYESTQPSYAADLRAAADLQG